MTKRIKIALLFGVFLTLFSTKSFAQLQKGQLVDGITAVIGDEIVLESDVKQQMSQAPQQGTNVADKCMNLENIINSKLLVYEAKKDTLIENQTAAIKENVEAKYNRILAQFPDEKAMLSAYQFRTAYELKNAIEKIDTDDYYMRAKYQRITEKADVTPNDVNNFYKIHQYQFPEAKDEVVLAQIVMYPKLTEAHEDEIINKLKKIKQEILDGTASFETQARIYSEDPSNASKGGFMKNISKGQMVKPFEAAALNLQEGEISDPVLTEFGYHLIRLERKAGKIYDASHILIMTTPTDDEVATAKKELDSIRTLIQQERLTFKEAAFKFSDDKMTKFNAGIIQAQDGSNRIEKASLGANVAFQVAGLNKSDISDAFEDEMDGRKVVKLMKIEDVIPAHQLTLETDYDRIKGFALDRKRSEIMEKWVKEKIPDVFISIDNRYKDCDFQTKWNKELLLQ